MGTLLSLFIPTIKNCQENPILLEEEEFSDSFFKNEKIDEISKNLQLTNPNLINLHSVFRKMDVEGTGYINLDSFFIFIEEELSSIISPYLERFFFLIEKEDIDKITFIEWLPAICVFCLYTSERILQFVFSLIDTDQDGYIGKRDLMKFLDCERFGKKIFPHNFIKAVEFLEIARTDRINLDQFKKIQSSLPFLCFPAFWLQTRFRKYILGQSFWRDLFEKISLVQNEENKKKKQKKLEEEKRKKASHIDKYKDKFEKKMKDFKIETNLRTNSEVRIPGRKASDSFIDLKHQKPIIFNMAGIKRINSGIYIKEEFKAGNQEREAETEKENENDSKEMS